MSTMTIPSITPTFAPRSHDRRETRPGATGRPAELLVAAPCEPVAAAANPTVPASAKVRLTRRGRAVLVLGFLALALAAMTVFGGWATATHSGGTPERVRVVEVRSGDTLYGIAGEVAKPGHVREMVQHIQELNSLPTVAITEGQKLAVPRG